MLLRRNVIANYLGQGWTALMGLAFIPVYIHYLGVEAWGLVGFMSLLQAWLTLLDMGLTPTLSREMARFQAGTHTAQSIRDLLRSLEVVYGGVAMLVVCAMWLMAPWVTLHWLNTTKLATGLVTQVISIIGLVLAARMTEQVYRGAIQGLQKQVWLNSALSLLATLRWVGVVGILAWVSPSIQLFFLWQGLVSILTVVILSRRTYLWLPPGKRTARFDIYTLVRIRRYAGGMAVTTFLALMLTQVDKLLLSKLVSLEDFGYYILAASVAASLSFLISPITMAVFPHLTELVARSDQKMLVETYHRTSQWLAAILIPVALVMAVFAEPLLYVWTGDTALTQKAAPLLSLLVLGTLFNGFMHVPYNTQLAHGWTGLAVRINIVAVIFIVPGILWAVPRFGAIGAAWAWLVLNLGYVLLGIHFMHKTILPGEKWRWYWETVFKPLFTGSIVLLVLWRCIVLPEGRVLMAVVLAGMALLMLVVMILTVSASREYLYNRFKMLRRNAANG